LVGGFEMFVGEPSQKLDWRVGRPHCQQVVKWQL
jgi:hypothetical protein